MLSIKQTADRLAVSTRVVRQLIAGHKLAAYRIGGVWRISEEQLAAYLAASETQPARIATRKLQPAGAAGGYQFFPPRKSVK